MLGDRPHALILIDRHDLADTMHPFDARFLNIQNPYVDARLKSWSGITIQAHFDAEGRRVNSPVEGGNTRELIPLALYSLEYPKVPLLLTDFRRPRSTRRREMFRRAANDTVVGVFGISRWGNWPYMAGAMGYSFVRSRHGDPNNRNERLAAYAQTRRWLALDAELDPHLREELLRRVDLMGVNPLEESVFQEQQIAPRQYAALERFMADPKGLAARLERDRNAELTRATRGWKAQLGFQAAQVFTLGKYRHREERGDRLLPALNAKRLAQASGRRAALNSGKAHATLQ